MAGGKPDTRATGRDHPSIPQKQQPADPLSAEAAEELVLREIASAASLYDRYVELSGITRLPTEGELEAWEFAWLQAERERERVPLGLVLEPNQS